MEPNPKTNAGVLLTTTNETLLYTAAPGAPATKELVKEVVICNVSASAAKSYLSRIPDANTANATNSTRLLGGRSLSPGETVILALTTVLAAGMSLTGKSDVANALTFTITTVEV